MFKSFIYFVAFVALVLIVQAVRLERSLLVSLREQYTFWIVRSCYALQIISKGLALLLLSQLTSYLRTFKYVPGSLVMV